MAFMEFFYVILDSNWSVRIFCGKCFCIMMVYCIIECINVTTNILYSIENCLVKQMVQIMVNKAK